MLLSDTDILSLQDSFEVVRPFDKKHLQPASYELHWSGYATEYNWEEGLARVESWDKSNSMDRMFHSPRYYEELALAPREIALVSTSERVAIPPGVAARVEGKSSLGRLGLAIHVTAGFIDPGFVGTITLELVNLTPATTLVIRPEQKIGQLCFFKLQSAPTNLYGDPSLGSAYQGQADVTLSKGTRG